MQNKQLFKKVFDKSNSIKMLTSREVISISSL